jgi:4-hydroxybenzoate polyprenyltransferase
MDLNFDGGMKRVISYIRLVKFSHTIFAMPFALVGMLMAYRINPDISFCTRVFVLIILAMIFARNAAMGFNRYIDRDVDSINPRTCSREIPAGVISKNEAIFFIIINSLAFIISCYFINNLAFILAFPTLLILLSYSYLKRYTALCHYFLGIALSIAPTGAYVAVTGRIDIAPVILSLIVLFWVSGFDIIYSLSDREFDKQNNLFSVPRIFGVRGALIVSAIGHIFVLPLLVIFYFYVNSLSGGPYFGSYYIIGASLFSIMLVYQHLIISSNDLSRIGAAFFTANGIASIVFAFFAILDLI